MSERANGWECPANSALAFSEVNELVQGEISEFNGLFVGLRLAVNVCAKLGVAAVLYKTRHQTEAGT